LLSPVVGIVVFSPDGAFLLPVSIARESMSGIDVEKAGSWGCERIKLTGRSHTSGSGGAR